MKIGAILQLQSNAETGANTVQTTSSMQELHNNHEKKFGLESDAKADMMAKRKAADEAEREQTKAMRASLAADSKRTTVAMEAMVTAVSTAFSPDGIFSMHRRPEGTDASSSSLSSGGGHNSTTSRLSVLETEVKSLTTNVGTILELMMKNESRRIEIEEAGKNKDN